MVNREVAKDFGERDSTGKQKIPGSLPVSHFIDRILDAFETSKEQWKANNEKQELLKQKK
jgi:hypothetical protein